MAKQKQTPVAGLTEPTGEDARAALRQEPPAPEAVDAPKPVDGYKTAERLDLLEYAFETRLGVSLTSLRAERAAKEG